MHAYDPPRRPSFQPVPAARPAQDLSNGSSATPIYDALYAEYVRSFRSLPGDRSGEEDLGFTAFANTPHGTGTYGTGTYGTGTYGAVTYGPRHGTPQHATGHLATTAVWQPGRQHATGMHHVPAALPPAPRRGM
ncbi:hypothetical protein [Streptomyces avermitilis]|uniref:hypothetical protein n=1 Tax=Streptomyces avermitilis TaxID=33903 RepID=UPI00382D3A3F